MNDITRMTTSKRASFIVVHNGTVYVAGITPEDRSQDIRGQTRQVLAKIDRLLAEAGTDKSRLLTAQIWVKDIKNDFAGMNEIWDAWTAPGAAPDTRDRPVRDGCARNPRGDHRHGRRRKQGGMNEGVLIRESASQGPHRTPPGTMKERHKSNDQGRRHR